MRMIAAPVAPAGPAALVPGGQRLHALDDALVASTAADVARERLADLGFARAARSSQEGERAHHEPGRAEAALEGWLSRNACWSGWSSPSDSRPSIVSELGRRPPGRRASGTSGSRRRRRNGARAAHAVLAAEVGSGEPEVLPMRSASVRRGSTNTSRRAPLTMISMGSRSIISLLWPGAVAICSARLVSTRLRPAGDTRRTPRRPSGGSFGRRTGRRVGERLGSRLCSATASSALGARSAVPPAPAYAIRASAIRSSLSLIPTATPTIAKS